MAGVPYTPPKECEDSVEFFKRMEFIDKKVSEILNRTHQLQSSRVNQTRKDMEPLSIGSEVWYRRPENSGEKLDSRWIGPGLVRAREGDKSYVIEIKPGLEMKAHRSFLKLYNEPKISGKGVPLYYYRRTEKIEDSMPDEWEVEKILRHRKINGKWEFLTKWVGYEPGEETWEPVQNFVHRFSAELVRYCNSRKISVYLMKELQKTL